MEDPAGVSGVSTRMTSSGQQLLSLLLLLLHLESLPIIHGMPCSVLRNEPQCGCPKQLPRKTSTMPPPSSSDFGRTTADYATSEDKDYYYIDDMAFRKVGRLASDRAIPLDSIDLSFWPGGIIFFAVDSAFSAAYREKILTAMHEIETRVGNQHLEFKEAVTRDKTLCRSSYLHIMSTHMYKCISEVGMSTSGKTKMWLNEKVCSEGTIQHELLHALGRYHEQCRADRDKHVTLFFENMINTECANYNFFYIDSTSDLTMALPYDSNSIMHYGSCFFTCNGRYTMLSKNGSVILPNRSKMTVWDVEKVRLLFPADARVPFNSAYMKCKRTNEKRSSAVSLHGSSSHGLLLLAIASSVLLETMQYL